MTKKERITVRLSKELNNSLAEAAKKKTISKNALMVIVLSDWMEKKQGRR